MFKQDKHHQHILSIYFYISSILFNTVWKAKGFDKFYCFLSMKDVFADFDNLQKVSKT